MQKLTLGLSDLGMRLTSSQVEQFETYYRELVEWNGRMNLTSITDYGEVQIKHFLDSLTVTLALTEEEMSKTHLSIIDIGTGAGFPGLPLKIFLSQPRLVLLDSTAKKAAFLRHVVEKLKLVNVEIVTGRAEEAAHSPRYREQFDLVVSRAVAPLSALVELALPFCRIGGAFVAQKKGKISPEVDRAGRAIDVLGGRLEQVKQIALPGLSDERYLIVVKKVGPTPDKYPRRSGIPQRRAIQEESQRESSPGELRKQS